MKVYVATYNHEYGTDVRAFRTSAGADAWRIELAESYWYDKFPDDEPPADKEKLAQMFWDATRDSVGYNEYYEINVCNVEE